MATCVICSESLSNGSPVSANCGHVFHETCFSRWLNMSSTCPQCRCNVRRSQMRRLYLECSPESSTDSHLPKNIEYCRLRHENDQLKKSVDVMKLMGVDARNKFEDEKHQLKLSISKTKQELRRVQVELADANNNLKLCELQLNSRTRCLKADIARLENENLRLTRCLDRTRNEIRYRLFDMPKWPIDVFTSTPYSNQAQTRRVPYERLQKLPGP